MRNLFPYRIRFAKRGRLRFLSHHDLMRTLERALRRTDLPLRMTEGHHPHPRLSLPTALGLGIESMDEIMEIELISWIPPRQVEEQLKGQLPEGIEVHEVHAFARRDRSQIEFVEYEALLPEIPSGTESKLREFMDRSEVRIDRPRLNHTQPVELRQYVLNLALAEDRIVMRIKVTDQGTAKPEEILAELGVPSPEKTRIRKIYTELGKRTEERGPTWKKRRPPRMSR